MRTLREIIFLAGAAAIVAPANCNAQPQFTGMDKPIGASSNYVIYTVSNEGVVHGWASLPQQSKGMYWTLSEGFQVQSIGQWLGASVSSAASLSNLLFGCASDGTRTVPVMWYAVEGAPITLEGFPVDWYCAGVYCNATGTVVVGSMQHMTTFQWGIFIWRAGVDPPMQFITEFPPGVAGVALQDVSHDGRIGFGGGANASATAFQGVRWRSPASIDLLGDAPGGAFESALGFCDWKGWRAAGRATPASNIDEAAFWDPKNGWVTLGVLKPEHCGAGLNMDDSGWFFAGSSGFCAGQATAITWTPLDGMRDLKDTLVNDYGLTAAAAWNLWAVDALSPNGKYLAGRGVNPQGKIETWWAEIIPFCYADCDRNKALNVLDFICYSDHYVLDDLYANCNNDANLDIFDIICFSDAFAKGCP